MDTLTTGISRTSRPEIWRALARYISSRDSAAGPTPLALPAGATGRSGPGPVPASLSPRQAKEAGSLTSGTYGPPGTISSASAALQSSLASRLAARTATLGSTLFKLTWKVWVTPAGRSFSLLRASARPTDGTGYGSWPSPTTTDGERRGQVSTTPKNVTLNHAAAMAAWPSPHAADASKGTDWTALPNERGTDLGTTASWATPAARDWRSDRSQTTNEELYGTKGMPLARQVLFAHWGTPTAQDADHASFSPSEQKRDPMILRNQVYLSGPPPNGSGILTASGGLLNPDHSRFLMGFSRAWLSCAPSAMPSSRKLRPKS